MNGWFVAIAGAALFAIIWAGEGPSMALSYLGLAIGLSMACFFATLAYHLWRMR